MELIVHSLRILLGTIADVLPIVVFIFAFQTFVIRKRLPNLRRLVTGLAYTIAGLALFLIGLEEALLPLGRLMAAQLTDPAFIAASAQSLAGSMTGGYHWIYVFALTLGFSTTIAEPALLAIALKANETSGGTIGVLGLRVTIAIGAAIGVCLGCMRIVTGMPLLVIVAAGYIVVILQTIWAPKVILPLAYDSGFVATSAVTVPLVTALGLGLAEAVGGRSALTEGFGMVAITGLFPIISVLAYAQISVVFDRLRARRRGKTAENPNSMEES